METPQSNDVGPPAPRFGRVSQAVALLDGGSKLAIVCVALAWFFIDTLVVRLGSLQHGVRFFDFAAVISDPSRMFLGVDAPLQTFSFALLCLACLAAPLAPHLLKSRWAWWSHLAPLGLIVVSGVLLYWKMSAQVLTVANDADPLSRSLARLANDLLRHGSGMVSRHVSIAAGGYWALIGSLVLAAQGIRQFRRHA